jgi:hypothetical protein
MTPERRRGFDWEGLFLAWGMGAAGVLFGGLFCWLGLSRLPAGRTASASHSLAQAAARALPQTVQQKILLALGVVFVLFGLLCSALGCWSILSRLFRREPD